MSKPSQELPPFMLEPSGTVRTNWKTIGSVIFSTALIVGGIFSIKHDIASATKNAGDAIEMVKDIKEDLFRLRMQLGQFDHTSIKKVQP